MEMISILIAPFVASLVITGIHCYLGLHIVSRGVIFVDLSLAQMAALGATTGIVIGYEMDSPIIYFLSLGFAFVGALIFALGRFEKEKIPQEAIIGIVYAVSSAIAVLLLQKTPHGPEELQRILIGSILFVSWDTIIKTLLIYVVIGTIHLLLRKQFLALTFGNGKERLNKRLWDFFFFVTFAIVVTSSVPIAGILLVFSYLVIPAVSAMFICKKITSRLIFGWIFATLGSLLGIWFSAANDFPTGASIIAVLAGMMIVIIVYAKMKMKFLKA
jgi:zinc/manganese transport system permease protein